VVRSSCHRRPGTYVSLSELRSSSAWQQPHSGSRQDLHFQHSALCRRVWPTLRRSWRDVQQRQQQALTQPSQTGGAAPSPYETACVSLDASSIDHGHRPQLSDRSTWMMPRPESRLRADNKFADLVERADGTCSLPTASTVPVPEVRKRRSCRCAPSGADVARAGDARTRYG
jgi:hypothetical protein